MEFETDNDLLGRLLYALANGRIRPEFQISYTVKDQEAAKNTLRGKAVTDAKEKAAVLTAAAGVRLMDIQTIDYSWGEIDFEMRPMNRGLLCETNMSRLKVYTNMILISNRTTLRFRIP